MRSFARDLGVSQSFLSQVLGQKRKLSDQKAVLIAEKLGLNSSNKKIFVHLVRMDLATDPITKSVLKNEIDQIINRNPQFKVLSEDVFNIIADWYYFAILELTTIDGFRSEPAWIARKLGISLVDTKVAIDRLARSGLLNTEVTPWKKIEKDYTFGDIPSAAIRKHHRDTLALAHKALEEQSIDDREFVTASFAMNPAQIKKAKKKIREFNESLMADMQESPPKSVYKLAIQFFRLDREVK